MGKVPRGAGASCRGTLLCALTASSLPPALEKGSSSPSTGFNHPDSLPAAVPGTPMLQLSLAFPPPKPCRTQARLAPCPGRIPQPAAPIRGCHFVASCFIKSHLGWDLGTRRAESHPASRAPLQRESRRRAGGEPSPPGDTCTRLPHQRLRARL